MADIAIWNGDICDLEVDAIVSPASPSLWMATGVAGAVKRRGGDAIEFAAGELLLPIGLDGFFQLALFADAGKAERVSQ